MANGILEKNNEELLVNFNKTSDSLIDMIDVAMELLVGNNDVREKLNNKFKKSNKQVNKNKNGRARKTIN